MFLHSTRQQSSKPSKAVTISRSGGQASTLVVLLLAAAGAGWFWWKKHRADEEQQGSNDKQARSLPQKIGDYQNTGTISHLSAACMHMLQWLASCHPCPCQPERALSILAGKSARQQHRGPQCIQVTSSQEQQRKPAQQTSEPSILTASRSSRSKSRRPKKRQPQEGQQEAATRGEGSQKGVQVSARVVSNKATSILQATGKALCPLGFNPVEGTATVSVCAACL